MMNPPPTATAGTKADDFLGTDAQQAELLLAEHELDKERAKIAQDFSQQQQAASVQKKVAARKAAMTSAGMPSQAGLDASRMAAARRSAAAAWARRRSTPCSSRRRSCESRRESPG